MTKNKNTDKKWKEIKLGHNQKILVLGVHSQNFGCYFMCNGKLMEKFVQRGA